MPTATGHEKEELEAELEVIPCVFFSLYEYDNVIQKSFY